MLGGNPSIIAHVSRNDSLAFAIPRNQYLGGKYRFASSRVSVDRQWRRDTEFRDECVRAYRQGLIAKRLLATLGYSSTDELIWDVELPLNPVQS